MDTNSCGSPQLETLRSEIAAMIRAAMLNHFRFIVTPGTERSSKHSASGEWAKFSQCRGKKQPLRAHLSTVGHPFTASATTSANLRISSSVVSKEHIQRTIDSSSIHT